MKTQPVKPKAKARMHSRSFMNELTGKYWRNSPDQEWADLAMASYLKISKRAIKRKELTK